MAIRNNFVQLMGILGTEVSTQAFANGHKVARARLSTLDKRLSTNGQYKDDLQWHNICAWNDVAEKMEKLLKKGDQALVVGSIVYRRFLNSQGVEKQVTEIKVIAFYPISRPRYGQANVGAESLIAAALMRDKGIPSP